MPLCALCVPPSDWPTINRLKRHMESHGERQKCVCGKTYVTLDGLRRHQKQQSCVLRDDLVVSDDDLSLEVDLSLSAAALDRPPPILTPLAGPSRVMPVVAVVDTDLRETMEPCPTCGVHFPGDDRILHEIIVHRPHLKMMCVACGLVFTSYDLFAHHINQVHVNAVVDDGSSSD